MTEEQWLDGIIAAYAPEEQIGRHARSIKSKLAEPRLPVEPSAVALYAMGMAAYGDNAPGPMGDAYRALYAELTKPKTKTLWRVEQTDGRCLRGVEEYADQSVALAEVTRIIDEGSHAYIWRKEVPND